MHYRSIGIAIAFTSVMTATPWAAADHHAKGLVPADKFDLSTWKINVPLDEDKNGKIDEIDVASIQTYSHPDYFYLNEDGHLVFATPNKATTTTGSSNTRSELRRMLRGTDKSIGTHSAKNNMALAAHPKAAEHAAIGGKMSATLKVDHVARRAGHHTKGPAYSVVVGQIHGQKNKEELKTDSGFGWGNEPLKIYYKKFPDHDTGSVFWNYERNLPKTDPDRKDISYAVWGNAWDNWSNPGDKGIKLGEEFSYVVNVHENTMYLTFEAKGKPTVKFAVNLANNIDPMGKVDEKDHPNGYAGDAHYFKAGAYNQCSTKDAEGVWYTACPGTGDWATDKKNGDYVQVTFSKLELSESEAPK